jgi:hypothetical protein
MGFLGTLFGGEAEADAANKNRQLYQGYGNTGQQYLKDTYGQGRSDLGQAVGAFSPLAALGQQYNQAGTLNLDALGVNGPEGNARATGAFQAGPGYQFAFDQGMDALNRRRAAGGMLNSGNADVDAIRFGQGTANQGRCDNGKHELERHVHLVRNGTRIAVRVRSRAHSV